MVSTGGSNGGLVNRDNGTVGVGNQVGVQVEGTTIAVGNWGSMGIDSTNGDGSSNDRSSSNDRGGSNNGTSGSKSSSLGSEVIGTSGSNSGLINRDNGTIGVGNQVGVKVEGAGVAVSRGVGRDGSNGGDMGDRGSGVTNGSSCNDGTSSELGGEVIGLQSSHTGLVNGGDGSVGVTLQTKETLGGGKGESGGENLKENLKSLHSISLVGNSPETSWCIWLCARAQTEEG